MSPLASTGRFLIIVGIVLVGLGALLLMGARLPRLPGDIVIERPNVTVVVPLGTMLVVSVLLTIILNLVLR
jgi:hypothetical protein